MGWKKKNGVKDGYKVLALSKWRAELLFPEMEKTLISLGKEQDLSFEHYEVWDAH